jgi:hypothetical protein
VPGPRDGQAATGFRVTLIADRAAADLDSTGAVALPRSWSLSRQRCADQRPRGSASRIYTSLITVGSYRLSRFALACQTAL